jgi:hypothetical protein
MDDQKTARHGPFSHLLGGLDQRQGPWVILAWGPGPGSTPGALGDHKHPTAAEIGSFLGANVKFGGRRPRFAGFGGPKPTWHDRGHTVVDPQCFGVVRPRRVGALGFPATPSKARVIHNYFWKSTRRAFFSAFLARIVC